MALRDPFHDLLEEGRSIQNSCGSDHTNRNNIPSGTKVNLHPGINILKTNTKIIYAGIFDKEPKETKGRLFFYVPGLIQVQSEEVIDTREKFFNIPPKNYTTKNDQHICIDLYVKYQVANATKSYQSSQSVISSVIEDIKALVDEYVGKFDDNYFDSKRKITINDLNQETLKKLENKYGINLTEITSNNIFNEVKHQINETAKKEAAKRIQTRENRELQLDLQQKEAETRMNIQRQQLEIEKQQLEMLSKAIDESKNADALARMYSNRNGNGNNQDMDIYHHDSRTR